MQYEMAVIVAKNIIKYCIDGSFRFQLRPLKPLSDSKDPTGRQVGLRPTHIASSIPHVAAKALL
jgi:hypothetical protein